MATPRHSGNRDIGNLRRQPASLVKPLIPLAIISVMARKDCHSACLPRVIFFNSRKMAETHPCKSIEKATQ